MMMMSDGRIKPISGMVSRTGRRAAFSSNRTVRSARISEAMMRKESATDVPKRIDWLNAATRLLRLTSPERRARLSSACERSGRICISAAVIMNSCAISGLERRRWVPTSSMAWSSASPASAQMTSRSSASGKPSSRRARRRAAIREMTASGNRQPAIKPAANTASRTQFEPEK